MKTLIYKDSTYYLSDDTSDAKGKTRILKYNATKDNMPHKHFSDYIVVYGRPSCPYCIKTFELLKKKKKKFIFVEVDSQPSDLFAKPNLLSILGNEIGSQTTVPLVFDKGKFIGGSSDAEKYDWS
jgi:glutaredoxin